MLNLPEGLVSSAGIVLKLSSTLESAEKLLRAQMPNPHDLGNGNGFLSMTPKAQETRKTDTLGFIKIKTFCIKGPYQESEKTTYRVGERTRKLYI